MKKEPKAKGHDAEATLRELPAGWLWVRLEDLASPEPRSITDGPFGSNLKSEHYAEAGPRVVRLENIGHGHFLDKKAHISPTHYRRLERHAVAGGDLVIAILGSPLPRACIVPASLGQAIVKADYIRFKPDTALVDNRFACWWINSTEPQKAAEDAIHGVGRPRLGMQNVKDLMVPLAPRQVQDRIVAKIDELFSDIEAGEKALEHAALLVKRYRQSVLKAAVTGELTKDWRAKNLARLKMEKKTGADLLADILDRRREAWEAAELAKLKAKGKPPKDDKWKSRYVEPAAPKTDTLPELPEGWAWGSWEQLSSHITSGSRAWSQYYVRGPGTFIMAQNVRRGRFDMAYRQKVDPPQSDPERSRTLVVENDLLVTIVGANTGDVCRVDHPVEQHYVCQSVALLRPIDPIMSRYIEFFFCADEGGQKQFRTFIYGAGRPHLSFEQLKQTAIPIPCVGEMELVISSCDAPLSEADASAAAIEKSARYATALRHSILLAAFSGQLVTQDPDDESASALIERIRAERADALSKKRRGKAKPKPSGVRKPGKAARNKQLDLI